MAQLAVNWKKRKGKRFKPENDSDGESGRSAELIQNGRKKHGAIPPDALYSASKKEEIPNSAGKQLYENLHNNRNDTQNPDALVYASLDLPNDAKTRNNGHVKPSSMPKRDLIEYAEIQFQPKALEHADV